MASKNTIATRIPTDFKIKFIEDIQLKRIAKGKDPKLKPAKSARLFKAFSRHRLFPIIKEDIINADLP